VKPATDTDYTLRCHGANSEVERSVSVSVVSPADLPAPEPESQPRPVVSKKVFAQPRGANETTTAGSDAWSEARVEEARQLQELLDEQEEQLDAYENAGGGMPPPVVAYHCCDMTGMQRCPLVAPVQVGSPCFCPMQGTGISCP
jgi:hypothetical protein